MFDLNLENDFSILPLFHERFKTIIPSLLNELNTYNLKNHYLFFSSGTNSIEPKGYALSKESLLINAQAVNNHFNLTKNDNWGLALPHFHVGGASVLIRSYLLSKKAFNLFPWTPHTLSEQLKTNQISIFSLVPTQIYDLVLYKIQAPSVLKYLIVGGDYLSEELEKKAKALGWPIIRSYGMTELGSQIATESNQGSQLKILPIHNIKIGENQQLWIKSSSLFTLEFNFVDDWKIKYSFEKMIDGHYPLSDRGIIKNQNIEILGRIDQQYKSSGHLVDLYSLKNILEKYSLKMNIWGQMEFYIEDDERKGKILCLAHDSLLSTNSLTEISKEIEPIIIDKFVPIKKLKRTDLGKFIKPHPKVAGPALNCHGKLPL